MLHRSKVLNEIKCRYALSLCALGIKFLNDIYFAHKLDCDV